MKTYPPPHTEFIVKPVTHTRLAAAYDCSPKTLYRHLQPFKKEIGPRSGYMYSIEQLLFIFETIGWPKHSLINSINHQP